MIMRLLQSTVRMRASTLIWICLSRLAWVHPRWDAFVIILTVKAIMAFSLQRHSVAL